MNFYIIFLKFRTIVITVFLMCHVLAPAQYKSNYIPLANINGSCKAYLIDPVEERNRAVHENQLLSSRTQAINYYSKMFFIKNQLLQSGQLYFNNEITLYVDSIISKLLSFEPNIKNNIKIYLTRFTQSNAFCFPDGSIFLNVGMIAALHNETELAFILAHEIAHYAEQHSLKDLKKMTEIDNSQNNSNTSNSELFRSLRFSRESESDADAWALQLVSQAGYNPAIASGALQRLKNENTKESTLNFKTLFENNLFSLDSSWYSDKAMKKYEYSFHKNDNDPISSGRLDDLFKTHPDLDKRIEAIDLMTTSIKTKTQTPRPIRNSMEGIRDRCIFERIENNVYEQDYVNAIIWSLRVLEKYPENNYLYQTISKSLYWLAYYKEVYATKAVIWGDEEENGVDFLKFYSMFSEMGLKDAKKMGYAFTTKGQEKFGDSEDQLFYLAMTTESYLGKSAARGFYRDYNQKYPAGFYSALCKIKLR